MLSAGARDNEPTLLGMHRETDLVAFGAAGNRTAADLLADAARVASVLPQPSPGSQVLLVFKEDRYHFAAALLGGWAKGHTVALPANTRRETVTTLYDREETVALVHDLGAGLPHRIEDVLGVSAKEKEAGTSPAPLSSVALPPRECAAVFFTSGSTGGSSSCEKTAAQLIAEARVLSDTFGFSEESRVAASVSPGHLYGFLFSVLVPLVSGGSFLRQSPLFGESLAAAVKDHCATTLVTVPLHLRALGAVEQGALGSLSRVFSSTGPLAPSTEEAFVSTHDLSVTEIFGSTETGGVAFRQRRERTHWTPLPGIQFSVDEDMRLWVKSPFLQPADRPFRTADLAEKRADGSFEHLGRADRVLKIGGRRLSLGEMEQWLQDKEGVQDVAALSVPAATAREHNVLLAVVSACFGESEIRAMLLERFDESTLPRRILTADALPREPNGKLTRKRLMRLFGLNEQGLPLNYALRWEEPEEAIGDGHQRHVFPVAVPDDYAWFDGHFPGYPVMAGAVQIKELVLPAVKRVHPALGRVTAMNQIKFTGRITPGERLRVELERKGAEPLVHFKISSPKELCSAGRIHFATE